jgi:hypothetical protein
MLCSGKMKLEEDRVRELEAGLDGATRARLEQAAAAIVRAKEAGERVVVVVGSGPNIHEGVTTLLASLIHAGIVDGVITSSAVISHEMAGALDRVHRVAVSELRAPTVAAPHDGILEASLLSPELLTELRRELPLDEDYYKELLAAPGSDIIKAAGNMAYPMGWRTERLAREAQALAAAAGLPLETVAGFGADPMTMIGAGARCQVPVLVGVPQLVGGGAVGLAIGDSLSISERSSRVARMLGGARVIVESAVALTQEIHDGPFETYTGHGIWAAWDGGWTYSLADKQIVRFDLDPNLERAWQEERQDSTVSRAIAEGLPKTKLLGLAFRMEMSGFARLPGSLPVVADIGVVWPVLAWRVATVLGISLDFLSSPQSTPEGQVMRDWIVENVSPVSRQQMRQGVRRWMEERP